MSATEWSDTAAENQRQADANSTERIISELAEGVLRMAHLGGMPESYWHTDQHLLLACEELQIDTSKASEYGHMVARRVIEEER